MKEFRFVVEFEDGNCDFRTAKGNTEEEAAINLSKVLIKQHESKMIKGKKALRIEVQL